MPLDIGSALTRWVSANLSMDSEMLLDDLQYFGISFGRSDGDEGQEDKAVDLLE